MKYFLPALLIISAYSQPLFAAAPVISPPSSGLAIPVQNNALPVFGSRPQPSPPPGYSQVPASLNQQPQAGGAPQNAPAAAPAAQQPASAPANAFPGVPTAPLPTNAAIPTSPSPVNSSDNPNVPPANQANQPKQWDNPNNPSGSAQILGGDNSSVKGLGNLLGKVLNSGEDAEKEKKRKEAEKAAEKQVQDQMRAKIEYMEKKNYHTQILPEAIYKKGYSPDNGHLPHAVYESDYDGALFSTIDNNDMEALRAVIRQGRSLEVRDLGGDTPFIHAALTGNNDAARLLLAHGADIDAQGKYGTTALQIAAFQGNETLARLLLEMNADPDIKNEYGKTAGQIAESRGNYGVALLLVARSSELAFSEHQENIKRFHREEENKKEAVELSMRERLNPAKPYQEKSSVKQPLPEKTKTPELKEEPAKPEESVKDKITNFLRRLVSREKEQEETTKEKIEKRKEREEPFIEPETIPKAEPHEEVILQPAPAAPTPEPAPVNKEEPTAAPTIATPPVPAAPVAAAKAIERPANFKRAPIVPPKFFIPDTLFPETKETPVSAPETPEAPAKLPGEEEKLPNAAPQVDLPKVINSIEGQEEGSPANQSVIISSPTPVVTQPTKAVGASPGAPLRGNLPETQTPLGGSSNDAPVAAPQKENRNNVMIPNQPGITSPASPSTTPVPALPSVGTP